MNILTINSGSSSIKFSLVNGEKDEQLLLTGRASGIGFDRSLFAVQDRSGDAVARETNVLPDHGAALRAIIEWLRNSGCGRSLQAVGHRIVHGGSEYAEPHLIDTQLMSTLDGLIPFAPDHLPHEIAAIREIGTAYPGTHQVACFDTAFHRSMPEVAQQYALPGEIRERGVLRYGFHGLSYEFILSELRARSGPETAEGRVIVAHLGNGASMAAFRGARSMDTTMGFTPAGGLVMSTRSGDLDPGVVVYLLRNGGIDADGLNRMVNKDSGLIGISGFSADMRELLDAERSDPRASKAVGLFCYQAKKYLGALAAALGGLDTLVFTGGIGENAAAVRERICSGLSFLGISVDDDRNGRHEPVISPDGGRVAVRVMKTNEELMIARHTHELIRKLHHERSA